MVERLRILAVEDEPDIGALYSLLFKPDRYTVTVAGDLATTRAILATLPLPDLILLDLHLPDACGLDLCRTIKAAHPALPVIVLTACTMARTEALGAGADAFLSKPFDVEELEAVVRTLLECPTARPA